MEHDPFQGQQSHLSGQPPAGGYGSSSDHMGTATSNITAGLSSDLSASNYSPTVVPRGRPPRLGPSVSSHRPMHSQQHAPSQQPGLDPNSPYYGSQQTQPPSLGQQQQQQQQQQRQQHYLSQPMSPTLYYPTFPHMHQQTPSPTAYNVNQGYMSASAGPSIPVTYAYSHPYAAHVSDHQLHPFAYTSVGMMTSAPLPVYPEQDGQGHQRQMQNRSGSMDMMGGYMPVISATAAPYGYSIPAYAANGGSVFTPQYTGGHPYGYTSFPSGYGQSHQGPGPPPLNLSQPPVSMHGPSQSGPGHSYAPPSPFSNANQETPGRSPTIVAPSPTLNLGRVSDLLARNTSDSNLFGSSLGLNPGASTSISGYGSSGDGSSGEVVTLNRLGAGVDSTCSTVLTRAPETEGAQSQEPSSSQRERAPRGVTSSNRQDRQGQAQTATEKGDRSEWVMWVGNVPGDASLNELYTFFGQGPAIPEEERKGMEKGESMQNIPQLEGVALGPNTRDVAQADGPYAGLGVGGTSGVISVFLISRSNCAFVNYVSEASLQRGVDWFNGRPLRDPQVDPRCPKLVCRVRKKGDDVKAGVGGQRGVGTHARWVKEKKGAVEDAAPQGSNSTGERPPLVHGGPAKKSGSGSGSSTSYASTTSSMLIKYFPTRYFILKSLTQHDLDLSVERGLWATQAHNQEVLDQAYRNCQNVFLIFGVNKSGEFFGYAKMDGPISSVERNPSIEWAAREPAISSSSAKVSPVAVRGAPSQPSIQEERDKEDSEHEKLPQSDLAPILVDEKNPSIHSSEATTAHAEERHEDPRPFSSVPSKAAGPTRHSLTGEFPNRREEKAVIPPHHQISEPAGLRQREKHPEQVEQNLLALHNHSPAPDNTGSPVSPAPLASALMARVFPGSFQDSPDPLTPGEDRVLHSLENVKVPYSAPELSRLPSQSKEQDMAPSKKVLTKGSSGFSIASAPAIMHQGHKPLSASTPVMPSDTWDEHRRGLMVWTKGHSIEEEAESVEDEPSSSQSLPPENNLAVVGEGDEASPPSHIDLPPQEHPAAPGLSTSHSPLPDSIGTSSAQGATTVRTKAGNEAPDARAGPLGGREEGWGTPFKVKWIRTDPLPFHRTRHLRNPWNHDREIKVSRDGTEVEPVVGQKLFEEWDRTDTGAIPARSSVAARHPTTYGGPPSPVQMFIPRGRGRGRGGMGDGWTQRDTGQLH